MSQECNTTAQWANIPLKISLECNTIAQWANIPLINKQYNGNGPISHYQNAQYTCSVNVNKFNVKSLYECAICARTSAYHKHPFEVGFDDNATCTSVHPPPIGRPTLVTASKLHLKQSPLTNGNAEEITGD